MSPMEKVQVCIIGGGPTGIIYLKELVDAGVTSVRVIEAKKTSGGLYRGCYEDAMLTTSNSYVTFSKMHNTDPVHMYCEEYADYCDEFVSKFQLEQYISFETVATKCSFETANKIWTVHYQGIGADGAHGIVAADYLVVAAGANAPAAPSSKGLPSCTKLPGTNGLPCFENFDGTVIHSSEYKSAKIFDGKRVLVVGCGESGSDIAVAATTSNSTSVAVSVRGVPGHITPRALGNAYPSETRKIQSGNGNTTQKNFPLGPGESAVDVGNSLYRFATPRSHWLTNLGTTRIVAAMLPFLPDELTPKKKMRTMLSSNILCGVTASNQYGTKTAGLPQALMDGATLVPGIKEVRQQFIVFVDGTELEIDLVVLCTGFKTTFPFLEEEAPRAIYDFNPRKLWKHMIDPEYGDRLVFGGFVRPAFGSIPQLSEMQARVYAQLISGNISLPSEKTLVQTIAKDSMEEEKFFKSSKDITALTHFAHYSADMASLIGKNVDYRQLLVTEPKLFLRLATTPFNVKRFYVNDDTDKTLRYEARNQIIGGHKGALAKVDLHIWLVCFAITTLVDIPMMKLPGIMPPTREQRIWAWLTLPFWGILMLPSLYEYVLMWLFALMSPYTWLHFYRSITHGSVDLFWAMSILENPYIQKFFLDPFSSIAALVFVLLSLPIVVAQAKLTKWSHSGEC